MTTRLLQVSDCALYWHEARWHWEIVVTSEMCGGEMAGMEWTAFRCRVPSIARDNRTQVTGAAERLLEANGWHLDALWSDLGAHGFRVRVDRLPAKPEKDCH